VWDFFKTEKKTSPIFKTDIHSHLLPGIDDGVKTLKEAEEVIRVFTGLGFTKSITTPHIMSDSYRNTPAIISAKAKELNAYLTENKIQFDIQFAAEYYFDEFLMDLVSGNSELLTFGDQYLLFETNTFAEPMLLDDFIFKLKVKGIKPVMAHPERYQYLENNNKRIEDLLDRGVLFQVNSLALSGHYSKAIQKNAYHLVERKLVHFLGSDCHTLHHATLLKDTLQHKYFKKALELPLLNYSI
jgi:tyrosine-protein phosphatase YwqE